ncbi:MAG: flagellar basal body rod protein FlgC [candidate division FCPU426 bacterium]
MNLFPEMSVSASGLTAERTRLEVIARNLANANTTKTADGGVFRRQLVELVAQPQGLMAEEAAGVQVAGIVEDPSPLKQVYSPGHPDADENGYLTLPNVDVMLEMVDMLGAARAYEANVSLLQSAKEMARQALSI